MSRIGRIGAGQIYDFVTGENVPRVDEGQALEGYQLVANTPFTNKLNNATFKVKWNFYDMTDSLSDKQFVERAKKRYNKTEYQMKVGRRSEGSRFEDAKVKPYIEFAQMAGNTFIDEAPNLKTLPESQQHFLKSSFPDELMKDSKFDAAQQLYDKFDEVPTDKQKVQIANTQPIEFINKKLAKVETYPTEAAGRVNGGSNIRLNWEKEMGQPTNLVSEKQGVEIDKALDTRINAYQRGANKARQIIGLYKERPVGQQIKETLGNVDYLNNSINDQLEAIKEYKRKLGITQAKKEKRILNVAPLKSKEEEKKIHDKRFGVQKKPVGYGKLKIKKNVAEY